MASTSLLALKLFPQIPHPIIDDAIEPGTEFWHRFCATSTKISNRTDKRLLQNVLDAISFRELSSSAFLDAMHQPVIVLR